MKRNILFFFLWVSLGAIGQPGNQNLKDNFQHPDTIQFKAVESQDSLPLTITTRDTAYISPNNENDLLDLYNSQQKLNAKRKRAAYIRIGIGIFFLVILVIGLMRRPGTKKREA